MSSNTAKASSVADHAGVRANSLSDQDDVAQRKHALPKESVERTSPCEHLTRFNMYGWKPDPELPDDENFMDIVLLITRNSVCLQGCMGCILVQSSSPDNVKKDSSLESGENHSIVKEQRQKEVEERIYRSLIGSATNAPLFSNLDSDVHAEIGALGVAAKMGNSTDGSTAYITMPPCKRCFASLLVSGVKRIVTRQASPKTIQDVSKERGIEIVDLSSTASQQAKRIDTLTRGGNGKEKNPQELAHIAEQRKRRKEEKLLRKQKCIAKRQKCADNKS